MSNKNHLGFLPKIDSSRCTGCGYCVAACPLHLLSLETTNRRKTSVITDIGSCTGCRLCERNCWFNAIAVVKLEPALLAAISR